MAIVVNMDGTTQINPGVTNPDGPARTLPRCNHPYKSCALNDEQKLHDKYEPSKACSAWNHGDTKMNHLRKVPEELPFHDEKSFSQKLHVLLWYISTFRYGVNVALNLPYLVS